MQITARDTENKSGEAFTQVPRGFSSALRSCQGVGVSSVFLNQQVRTVDDRLHPGVHACSDGPEYVGKLGAGLSRSLTDFVWISLSTLGLDAVKAAGMTQATKARSRRGCKRYCERRHSKAVLKFHFCHRTGQSMRAGLTGMS